MHFIHFYSDAYCLNFRFGVKEVENGDSWCWINLSTFIKITWVLIPIVTLPFGMERVVERFLSREVLSMAFKFLVGLFTFMRQAEGFKMSPFIRPFLAMGWQWGINGHNELGTGTMEREMKRRSRRRRESVGKREKRGRQKEREETALKSQKQRNDKDCFKAEDLRGSPLSKTPSFIFIGS